MLAYKILITQTQIGHSKMNVVRLVTPDERSYDAVRDPNNPHLFKVEVHESSLRPYDSGQQIDTVMEMVKKRWFKDQMPLFIEFLKGTGEIRLVYLKERFPDRFSILSNRRSLLLLLAEYGALDPTTHGGYKRSVALNNWLAVTGSTFTDVERGTAPEVPFSRVQKVQDRDLKRKLSRDEISALGIDELREYIERVKKSLKAKDLQWVNNLLYKKRSEVLAQQGETDTEYTTIDRTKK